MPEIGASGKRTLDGNKKATLHFPGRFCCSVEPLGSIDLRPEAELYNYFFFAGFLAASSSSAAWAATGHAFPWLLLQARPEKPPREILELRSLK